MKLIFIFISVVVLAATESLPKDWYQYNYNLKNTRAVPYFNLSPRNVRRVSHKCDVLFTPGEAAKARHQAQPIIVDDVMYISGNYGLLKAIRLTSAGCEEMWSFDVGVNVFGYDGSIPVQARITPAYYEKRINPSIVKGKIISIGPGFPLTLPFSEWFTIRTKIFQIDAETGTLDWSTDLTLSGSENVEEALISSWSSPTIVDGVAYFGLSGAINIFPTATLQFFLGEQFPYRTSGLIFAVDVANGGQILWKKPTLPRKPANYNGKWFSGGGVWSSGPSVINRGPTRSPLLLFGSGQFYSVTNVTENCLSTPQINAAFGTTFKGETGAGLLECYDAATAHAISQGATQPLAAGSAFAIDAKTGDFVWSRNLIGADTWLVPCGLAPVAGSPGCDTPVPGPDWDAASGQAPALIKFRGKEHVFTHTKGGLLYILDPETGKTIEKWDICHGSAEGGIHLGFSYDPVTHRLIVPCAAGVRYEDLNAIPISEPVTVSTLADGNKRCHSGHLNAIDLDSEKLIWQAVPAGTNDPAAFNVCQNPTSVNSVDRRFKYNIGVTKTFKDLVDPNVKVVYYDNFINNPYPIQNDYKSSIHGPGIIGNKLVFWTTAGGKVYVTDTRTGEYVHDLDCPENGGGLMGAGVLISGRRIMFGCGDQSVPGNKVRVYEHPSN